MVSIIVGIYNVATYLKRKQFGCISSQSFFDWELILVDDGSTDESGDICDELSLQDTRIRVIHKENGGLGSARNVGLDAAQGEYIWFYDVDDEVAPNLLEYCVREMKQRDLEMLQFGFRAITPSQDLEEDVQLRERMIENQNQLRECFLDDILFIKYGNGFSWNKILRRSFIEKNHLRFENQRIQQDEVFNLKAYPLLQRVYLSPEVLYHYYIYEKGNTRSRFIPNRFDIYVSIRNQFEKLRKEWNITDYRYDDYLNKRFYQNVDQTLRFNLLHSDCPWNKQDKKNEMKRVMDFPYTKEAMDWARRNICDVESNLYYQTYKHYNIFLLLVTTKLFSWLRKIKHNLA